MSGSYYNDWSAVKIPCAWTYATGAGFRSERPRVRLGKGMTLEALADEVGLAYSYVGEIERGRRNPTLNVVERIAEVLKLDPLELLRSEP